MTNLGKHPNVLVILADQLRRDALAIHGDLNVKTPNIDRLAGSGVRFEQASATSPICVPYRFTLMTGQYAHSRQVPGIEWRMSPAETTLADPLNQAGYQTQYVGKWHLYGGHGGAPWSSAQLVNRTAIPREHQGRWQVWRGFELRNDPFDTCYFRDDDPTPIPLPGFQTDALTDLAMETIAQRDETRPFFCLLSVEPPHPPYAVPREYEARWSDREIALPPNFRPETDADREELLRERRLYYAAIENLDDNVGRLLEFLDERELTSSTVVIFLSDHGELGGSHGLREKQYPYEPSLGVPFIVADPRYPQRAGSVIYEPVCTEDLFPTILGLTGCRPRAGLPGHDLTSLIRGETDATGRPAVLLEFVAELRPGRPFYEGGWRGVRTTRHKYTRLRTKHGSRAWQLFDLEGDPHEMDNLVDDPGSSELREDLDQLLARLLTETGDDFPVGENYE